jgi:hypothetical protein
MKIKKTSAWITDGVVDGKPMKKPLWHFLVEIEDYHYRKQKDGSHKPIRKKTKLSYNGRLSNFRLSLIKTDKQITRVCRRRFIYKMIKDIVSFKNAEGQMAK